MINKVDKNWRCPVCGSSATSLRKVDDRPNAVRCVVCNFPFSLPSHNKIITPLPAHNDVILNRWKKRFKEDTS